MSTFSDEQLQQFIFDALEAPCKQPQPRAKRSSNKKPGKQRVSKSMSSSSSSSAMSSSVSSSTLSRSQLDPEDIIYILETYADADDGSADLYLKCLKHSS
ncbi:hypothetical protein SEMRO_1511_G278750.1 [Seminavis robusta]|uniref:Uncharacterized protein n=1 Tax=Seminavis robusta TaxID=568900 RepID=A0A9N8EQH3_9STRA|nr:hypothetical protein SEMRO_1511_G278750.1 [Seminavis robusta]|eukprot:Sro1511_g278750.1 n/a (100) ;mRNA; r:18839-19138